MIHQSQICESAADSDRIRFWGEAKQRPGQTTPVMKYHQAPQYL